MIHDKVVPIGFRGPPRTAPAKQLEKLAGAPLEREFSDALAQASLGPLKSCDLRVLQLNLGKRCNQMCRHCHVGAGPDRSESMSRETAELCVAALAASQIPVVDITGGAPEMNPSFRWLVEQASALGRHVMDRCNLTILLEPGFEDLPEFLARHRVEVVCSLPHYRAPNTDRMRGTGVYAKSIAALKRLNAAGYGDGKSGLRLVLVTNPAGAFLPGAQGSLEAEWKRELARLHGVRFDTLLCLANMPIGRFLDWLETSANLHSYLSCLEAAFNPAAALNAMCRTTLSVGWDGTLYDCDFNQMLELPVGSPAPTHIRDFDLRRLQGRPIVTARHCFGCTAGAGSSCGGATADEPVPVRAVG